MSPDDPEMVPDNYPEQVRAIRRSLGLTQHAFAVLVPVLNITVSRWETGQNKPTALAWQRLMQIKRHNVLNVQDDLPRLRRLAEAALADKASRRAFRTAMTPAVVLALLNEIERRDE